MYVWIWRRLPGGLPGKLLGHNARGVIDAPLPPALPPTLFARIGDVPLLILVILSFAGVGLPRRATLGRIPTG